MNKNSEINKLRFLLQRYYEAQTSPEEESLIVSLFAEIEIQDIPNDLIFDRKLFLSMRELHPLQTNLETPDDLLVKINREITEKPPIVSEVRKKKRKNFFIYTGSVAAACVLFAISVQIINKSNIIAPPIIDNLTESPSVSPEESIPKISDPLETKSVIRKSKENTSLSSPPPRINQAAAETEVVLNEESGYIEITDPEEARDILVEISKLLANNSIKTNEATHIVENTVNEYREITKSILK
ncbi:MAG: hypothetical protein K2K25_10180 [Muribaculaceae bacterium]|nr:hypothetical protein [Muribaculaceae bacterium]